jgi:hypothetical protein
MSRRRAAMWVFGTLFYLAIWPLAGFAFASVGVGDVIDNTELPVLGGGKHQLFSSQALANVFVFFRPHQDHSTDTLKALAACDKEFTGKPVHWVAVVSGSVPPEEARAAIAETGIKMPVLVDQDDALYRRLGVRLYPTVGVANGKFQLVAYEPFHEINYCERIRGKIRFALHEIDEAEVEKVDNPQRALMPNQVKGAVATRHVHMGEMYLTMKQPEKAANEARQILAEDPTFAQAHLLLGDAMAAQGKCDEAANAYGAAQQIDPGLAATVAEKRKACGAH